MVRPDRAADAATGGGPVPNWRQIGRQTGRPVPLLDGLTRRSSIRGILLVILLVSLLPVMALSTWQGFARLQRDGEAGQRQLLETAMLTSASQRQVITGAQGLLSVLAAAPSVRSRDQARCGPVLKAAALSQAAFRNFMVSDPAGRIACASDPAAIGVQVTSNPRLWQLMPRTGFLVTAPVWGTVSKRMVLRAMLPLKTADGRFDGVLTASIDVEWLRRMLIEHQATNTVVALVDHHGQAVAASGPLPVRPLLVAPAKGAVFRIRSADGTDWSYAVAPLQLGSSAGERFHIVYAKAQPPRFGREWWFVAGYFLLPLLALILASMAIWVGANRAILSWVSQLGGLARQIGSNQRLDVPPGLGFADAPAEMRDLAADLLRMRGTIADREQRLRGAAAAQTEVARELHHRVRNNLQVIASFLSLQADGIVEDEARGVLEEARLRVAAMAMVNALLYADAEVTTVAMARLLDPIVDMLARHTNVDAAVRVDRKVAPRVVDIDRAIPLVLWIIEATLCLCERADATSRPSHFSIAMENEGDVMCIVVTMHGLRPDAGRASLHRRLVMAIALQQGANARIDDVGPSWGKIVLCLPDDHAARLA
ncbi:MAG: sensor histidine kinase [Sandarakinorhabdus sp.]|jgi:hypothetical protein